MASTSNGALAGTPAAVRSSPSESFTERWAETKSYSASATVRRATSISGSVARPLFILSSTDAARIRASSRLAVADFSSQSEAV